MNFLPNKHVGGASVTKSPVPTLNYKNLQSPSHLSVQVVLHEQCAEISLLVRRRLIMPLVLELESA